MSSDCCFLKVALPLHINLFTTNSPVMVKNRLNNKLKTSLKQQISLELSYLWGNHSAPYICYMHKGGN